MAEIPNGRYRLSNQTLALTCAENDWAAVQLLLYSDADILGGLRFHHYRYAQGPIERSFPAAKQPRLGRFFTQLPYPFDSV